MDWVEDTTEVVVDRLCLELLEPDGSSSTLLTDFCFDPSDPYAVTAVFRTRTQSVRWTFGRYLLLEGLYAPAGDGDVQVWPCLGEDGATVVMIELSAPEGKVMVAAPMRELSAFVSRTVTKVPPGTESSRVDMDAELEQLLNA